MAGRLQRAGGLEGRDIRTIVDLSKYDEGRDPVAERAREKL